MITRPPFLAAIVSSTVLLALTGCGKSASQAGADAMVAAATGGKVQVNQSGNGNQQQQVTIKDDKGNVVNVNTGNNVALPKDFPTDVHLPSSYTIKSAMQIGPTFALDMHTSATMQSVYSDYDSTMKSGGWTEAMAMQTSQSESMLTFQKDKRSVVVVIKGTTDPSGADVHVQSTADQK